MSDPKTQPVELNFKRTKHLKIRWKDGHESVIPLTQLRRACPCAGCQETRRRLGRDPLAVKQPEPDVREMVTVDGAELVGTYALKIRWKDGHDMGIYDFALLRRLG